MAVRGKTHQMVNSSLWVGCAWSMNLNYPEALLGLGGVLLGSILPDIDHPYSPIGRTLSLISKPLNYFLGHRGFIHTIWMVGIFAGVGYLFYTLQPDSLFNWFFIGLCLGYFLHLLEDKMSLSGLYLLYPLTGRNPKKRRGRSKRFKYRVGGPMEEFIYVLAILLMGIFIFLYILKIPPTEVFMMISQRL